MYDYVIVGAGLYGSVFAREMTDAGAKCLVVEKRNHIGGNCYTENDEGIHIHKYGPHIFHTDNKIAWDYINKYAKFNHFIYRPKVRYKNELYSFPVNLLTMYQLWGVKTPEEAKLKLKEERVDIKNPKNAEEWLLANVGRKIYETFFYGYTKKQWGTEPKNLPSFIVRRLPIRMTFDDNAYTHRYQGIPIGGYTQIFKKLLNGINIETGVDYLKNKDYYDKISKKILYTGPIDEFFNCELGRLKWRSLKFVEERFENLDYQGNSCINFSDYNIEYTRICEHKHFEFNDIKHTVITKEFPQEWSPEKEKYYPVNDNKNNKLYKEYRGLIDHKKYLLGGRLAEYKYLDMHQILSMSLSLSNEEKKLK